MITAATRAKIAIEIPVTNQKTKSIRPACLLAGCGSHGTTSATTLAPAPQTTPMATSWATDPLRTGAETTRRRLRSPGEAPRLESGSKRLQRARFSKLPEAGTNHPTKRRFDGTRSQHPARRGRCDPRVGRECQRLRRGHSCDRLDPARRRNRRCGALDDLLVDVGRPRLLVTPPRPRLPRRGPTALLDRPLLTPGAAIRPLRGRNLGRYRLRREGPV